MEQALPSKSYHFNVGTQNMDGKTATSLAGCERAVAGSGVPGAILSVFSSQPCLFLPGRHWTSYLSSVYQFLIYKWEMITVPTPQEAEGPAGLPGLP